MTIWLVINTSAGNSNLDATFWRFELQKAGLQDITDCTLDDTSWTEKIHTGDWLLAAGGDGTVSQVARYCLASDAVLGVLPSGTANDFARNVGLLLEPETVCSIIAKGQTRHVDVAWANQHLFLNVSHVGLGTWPVRQASRNRKRLWGKFSYALEVIHKLWAYRGFHAAIHCDDGYVSGRWLTVAVATGAYWGAGNPIPGGAIDDGQLDMVAVRPRSPFKLLLDFVSMRLGRESLANISTVVHLRGSRCHIQTKRPKKVTADGEIRTKTPLEVQCGPGRLEVLCEKVVTA